MNIEEEIKKYRWYHSFDLGNGVHIKGDAFDSIWNFIKLNLERVEFTGKHVIDIGCRDGMFSFYAERAGADRVVGIDNDLSNGATEFLIPHFNSKVSMRELSIYNLSGEYYDITMMFGLIYHLRYPFNGLRAAVNATMPDGLILIEGGIFRGVPQGLPMLYCPFKEGNPYEPGSPSYFNPLGLITAMDSFGCTLEWQDDLEGSDSNPGANNNVRRGFFAFRKTHKMPEYLQQYWEGVHHEQSAFTPHTHRPQ